MRASSRTRSSFWAAFSRDGSSPGCRATRSTARRCSRTSPLPWRRSAPVRRPAAAYAALQCPPRGPYAYNCVRCPVCARRGRLGQGRPSPTARPASRWLCWPAPAATRTRRARCWRACWRRTRTTSSASASSPTPTSLLGAPPSLAARRYGPAPHDQDPIIAVRAGTRRAMPGAASGSSRFGPRRCRATTTPWPSQPARGRMPGARSVLSLLPCSRWTWSPMSRRQVRRAG